MGDGGPVGGTEKFRWEAKSVSVRNEMHFGTEQNSFLLGAKNFLG